MGHPPDRKEPSTAVEAAVARDGISQTPTAAADLLGGRPLPEVYIRGYRTVPDHTNTGWPPGIAYIVGNEACERFSYYGMRAILFVHLVSLYAVSHAGDRANELARSTTHLFFAGVYALPMIGAIIADRFAGKFRTILYISLFYCAGHAVLSGWENVLTGVYIGLILLAIGSGGIKPCVSANVGDQFGKANWFRVRTVYQIFYFSINFGSFFATLLIPQIRAYAGPSVADFLVRLGAGPFSEHETARLGTSVAFAIPGVLMFLATLIFWLGRRKFVHVPPNPGGTLGLLDTLSSTALFMSLGHLFFTAGQPWWVILVATVGFLALGLALFALRQRLAPDDGFLAIMLYTLIEWASGGPSGKGDCPPVLRGQSPFPDGPPLAESRFWGPAVRSFGLDATEGPVAVLKIISVLLFISVFWALFDQHATSWIEQAKQMDLTMRGYDESLSFTVPGLGWMIKPPASILPNQIQALNPMLVMLMIPLVNLLYRGCDWLRIPTPRLGRMTVGMFVTAASFVAAALLQRRIDTEGDGAVWWLWQVVPYVLLTVGEIMVSITALEFAYTQAPKRMKSTIMSFLNLTITIGNVFVALLTSLAGLPLATFFWVFAWLMAGAGVLFGLRSYFYVQKDYPQE